jgi:hemerythrin
MYQFTDDCRVGIEQIDNEHAKLFELLNQTTEMVKKDGASHEGTLKLLAQLKEYAANHFAHEEAYMEQIHDPELARQKKEHALFTEKVNSYSVEGLSEKELPAALDGILVFMARWLYRHILGSDIMIGKFTGEETVVSTGETMENISPENVSVDPFAFTNVYVTGIDFVDQEHQKLFDILREANDLVLAQHLHDKYDAIVHIIGQLKEYTVKHFSHEEAYMERIGYDGLEHQRIAHTAFIDRINEINLEQVDDNQTQYLKELIEFLTGWLTNHILKMDKRIPT